MPNSKREILVTAALPYANGPLHIGHMVEQVQTDIWTRFQRAQGATCYFICATDAHGTPIMLQAQKQNKSPESLVNEMHKLHKEELDAYSISVDNYHSTHSTENEEIACQIYKAMKEKGHIVKKELLQAYDPEKAMFLPDRYVKGTCPKCKAEDQYGDNCEKCGAHYETSELINLISTISGKEPIQKSTEHYYFTLDQFSDWLQTWLKNSNLQKEVTNKLDEWFKTGLQQWDITRNAPYFGFNIPGHKDLYFYVWLDAPIGYISSFKNYCDNNNLDFKDYWKKDSTKEVYHFIGKDIIYFHTLFWPAVLHASNHRTPTGVFAHGFLTVNGEKMSKSRGTFLNASHFRQYVDPEFLRYYFATKLSNTIDDLDFNFDDFISRVNSDLVGKLVNIPSRCASFIHRNFNSTLGQIDMNLDVYKDTIGAATHLANLYETREYSKLIRLIMSLADRTNQYIAKQQPWQLIKDTTKHVEAHKVCSTGINIFRILLTYLQPIIPNVAKKAEEFLITDLISWEHIEIPLIDHKINKYIPLLTRVDKKQVDKMLEENQIKEPQQEAGNSNIETIAETINIDDFAKVDLRVAKIIKAEAVPEAKKLLRLELDIGGETRQVFAGIKHAFDPEDLVGKHTVMVANLAPRKMRFGISEGMLVVAGAPDKTGLWLIEPAEGATPGMRLG